VADEPGLSFHPFQLIGVWSGSLSGVRRPVRPGDTSEPTFGNSRVRRVRLIADRQGFACEIRVWVELQVLEDEFFRAETVVVGTFATTQDEPVPLSLARAFVRDQALYLLWPFARAFLDQIATISGVGIPPLPLVVVPRGR
jgi:hypothetical protein